MALPERVRRSRNKPVEHKMSHVAKSLYNMSEQMSSEVGKDKVPLPEEHLFPPISMTCSHTRDDDYRGEEDRDPAYPEKHYTRPSSSLGWYV
jgi:hypothetical protein